MLTLFDTVGAVIVVTMACVDTGTEGDAREVETWSSSTASSDREDNMLARGARVRRMVMR